jgi:xanthine dehydrogenase YagR molybdenum-binding subunit
MLKQIGSARSRIDGAAKVTGRATYAADRKPDGQLYALAVRSPVAAGTITGIDTAPALAVPGVVAVYTHENAPARLDWAPAPEFMTLSGEALGRTALAEAEPEAPPAYLPLSGPDIVFAGQWIAVIAAETLEAARQATLCIRPAITAAPASVHPSADDRFLDPGFFFAADMQVRRGDWPSGAADARLCETYRTPMQLHHPMEPSATVASWDGDVLTVHDSTQGTMAARDYIARSLKVPAEKVRVVAAYVGGGFGGKNQMWPHQALAAHIARDLKRPVRLQLTRADMAVASGHRSETEQRIELRSDGEGSLSGLRHVSYVPTSMRGNFFEPCGLNTLMLYDTPALDVRHHVARKNIPSPTPFRAPGETPGSFAVECALDELAFQLRMNPLELRRRNFAAQDPYHRREWSSNQLLECYRRGSEAFGWPKDFSPPRTLRDGDVLVGYGMATTAYPAPALPATVRLRLNVAGPLVVETSATDIGTGMYTILAQTVADALGHPFDDIEVRLGDTALPLAPTAGRSKSTASLLPAAAKACQVLGARLDDLARHHALPAASNQSPGAILQAAGLDELVAEGSSPGMAGAKDRSYYSFGAHFVEVRVDEAIGRIRVSRIVSALDCGRIINPKTATSQIKGGIIFGLGMALMEAAEFHPTHHRIVGDNLADYAVPVNADVPDIDVIFLDTPDEAFNQFGARGLGEIGVPGMAAAIANAAFNATGRRFRNLPITPAAIVGSRSG